MIRWFAARRRQKRQDELERAAAIVRRLFPEPIAFVAQEWTRMVGHMRQVSADVWDRQTLDRRVLAFRGMSPAFDEAEKRFPAIREKIAEAAATTGGSEDDARGDVLTGILAEALIAAGETRAEVYATLFPD